MSTNLQVQNALNTHAQPVTDGHGNNSSLALSTDNVGIGTTAPNGRLHITGNWVGNYGALTLEGDKPTIRLSGGAVVGQQQWILHLGSDGPGYLQFFNGGTAGQNWVPVMSLTPDCNVEVSGDIRLTNADCAEDFDISEAEPIEPGMVMVLSNEDTLQPSRYAYDKRVAGVISGAGDYKPGIVLDKQASHPNRRPVALLGKVFCKVDADYAPIEVGDLLTSSNTLGHAMKATDSLSAFGAIIGKALRPLQDGRGLIPILIALQ